MLYKTRDVACFILRMLSLSSFAKLMSLLRFTSPSPRRCPRARAVEAQGPQLMELLLPWQSWDGPLAHGRQYAARHAPKAPGPFVHHGWFFNFSPTSRAQPLAKSCSDSCVTLRPEMSNIFKAWMYGATLRNNTNTMVSSRSLGEVTVIESSRSS